MKSPTFYKKILDRCVFSLPICSQIFTFLNMLFILNYAVYFHIFLIFLTAYMLSNFHILKYAVYS